jgi:hypothetical protein
MTNDSAAIFSAGPSIRETFSDCFAQHYLAINSAIDAVGTMVVDYFIAGDASTYSRVKSRPSLGYLVMNEESRAMVKDDPSWSDLASWTWREVGIQPANSDGEPLINYSLTSALFFAANVLRCKSAMVAGWDCKPGPDCSGEVTGSRVSEERWKKEREEILTACRFLAPRMTVDFV